MYDRRNIAKNTTLIDLFAEVTAYITADTIIKMLIAPMNTDAALYEASAQVTSIVVAMINTKNRNQIYAFRRTNPGFLES